MCCAGRKTSLQSINQPWASTQNYGHGAMETCQSLHHPTLRTWRVTGMVLSQAPIPTPHSEGKNECVLCALGCAAVRTHRPERMSTTLHLIPSRQGLSSNLGPCWCPGGPCDSPEVMSAPATMPKVMPPSCVVTPSSGCWSLKSLYTQQELYISPAPALKFLSKVVSHSS